MNTEDTAKRIGYVEVAVDLLQSVLFPRGFYPERDLQCSLPEDVKIIGIEQSAEDRINGLCRVYLESEDESFPVHRRGDVIARLPTPTITQTAHD